MLEPAAHRLSRVPNPGRSVRQSKHAATARALCDHRGLRSHAPLYVISRARNAEIYHGVCSPPISHVNLHTLYTLSTGSHRCWETLLCRIGGNQVGDTTHNLPSQGPVELTRKSALCPVTSSPPCVTDTMRALPAPRASLRATGGDGLLKAAGQTRRPRGDVALYRHDLTKGRGWQLRA
eukprot:6192841-Pleurochrysis_carterae.AAC.1